MLSKFDWQLEMLELKSVETFQAVVDCVSTWPRALRTISGTFWPFLPLKFMTLCRHSSLEDTLGLFGNEGCLSLIEIKLFIKDGGWMLSKVEHMELVMLDSSVSLSIDWF